jgi:hypothetical protein
MAFDSILDFLNQFHGDNTFEFRTIPEGGGGDKYTRSVIRHGDSLYKYFKGEREKINIYNEDGIIDLFLNPKIYLDSSNSGVFFTVNSPNFENMVKGSTSINDIKDGGKIVCQFLDIDAPTTIRNNRDQLKDFKNEKANQIMSFVIKPSFVIETKHGYHVYYLLINGEHKLFRHIQMQLIQEFDGDPACVDESRVLRLPFFTHKKDFKNQFNIIVRKWASNLKYTQSELINVLPELKEKTYREIAIKATKKAVKAVKGSTRLMELLISKLGNYNQVDNKIRCSCCMPDHVDPNPSAWFDINHNWYHCSGCNTHLALDELSDLLEWTDIIDEINLYELDVDKEIQKIRIQMIEVKDMPELELNEDELKQVEFISAKVIDHFQGFGQNINDKHKQYIYDIVQILYKGKPDSKPYLIPLDMGAGKSTIIEIFAEEMLRADEHFGMIVVKERTEDVKAFSDKLNIKLGEVAFPLYGFNPEECEKNKNELDHLSSCLAMKPRSKNKCEFRKECRYYNQLSESKKFPVISMTKERLHLSKKSLAINFRYFYSGREKLTKSRDLLISDEKLKLVDVAAMSQREFETRTKYIINDIQKRGRRKESIIREFEQAISKVNHLFMDVEKPENFPATDKNFNFSAIFWTEFNALYDYTKKDIFRVPDYIQSIIRNGGHIESKTDKYIRVSTAFYNIYTEDQDFQTVIFDGTADIDPEYIHEKYHLFKFDPIRLYENLTIYMCNSINSSKTSMNEQTVEAFCLDVIQIIEENQNEKLFVAVYMVDEIQIKTNLREYENLGRVIIAHFGETRGSNNFKECSIIIVQGVLHKTEEYYCEKAKAIGRERGIVIDDISVKLVDNTRRFNDPAIEILKQLDMVVDYSQEFKRGSQRDNSRDVEGKIYIFHKDKIFLDKLRIKFPGCKVEKWVPKNILNEKIGDSGNNTAIRAIRDVIEKYKNMDTISFEFIKSNTEVFISDQVFSNTLKKQQVQEIIFVNDYTIQQVGRNKFLVKNIKALPN